MTALDAGRFTRDAHRHRRAEREDLMSDVLAHVAEEYRMALDEMMSRSRKVPRPLARQHAMLILHDEVGMSKMELGGLMDYDRTTVRYGISRMRERVATPYFATIHERLLCALQAA